MIVRPTYKAAFTTDELDCTQPTCNKLTQLHDASALIHTATPDATELSCLCRGVRFGGVNWILPDNSRLSPTENVKSEHVQSCAVLLFWPSSIRGLVITDVLSPFIPVLSHSSFRSIVQFTPAHQTRHRQDHLVASGAPCELSVIGHVRQRREVDWLHGCSSRTAIELSSVRLL